MDARELLVSPIAYMPPARLLDGLTPAQSEARIGSAGHTAAETLAHLVFWQSWFLDRCNGKATPMAETASAGWPAASGADWEELRQQFLAGLEQAVSLADDGERRVDPAIEFPPLAEYTVRDALTHLGVHNAHHLGQIVTLRQIMGAWPPPEGSWTW